MPEKVLPTHPVMVMQVDVGCDSVFAFVFDFILVIVFFFAWNSPRLVTLVVRVAQVAEVHLELKTEGNITPSESE